MFGLLKKKLSTFSDRLKQTVAAKPAPEKEKPLEEQPEAVAEEKKAPKAEEKAEQKKEAEAKAREEKKGKKSKEGLAEEMERKMFEDIDAEIKEEEEKGKRAEKAEKKEEKKAPEEAVEVTEEEAEEEEKAFEEAEEEIEAGKEKGPEVAAEERKEPAAEEKEESAAEKKEAEIEDEAEALEESAEATSEEEKKRAAGEEQKKRMDEKRRLLEKAEIKGAEEDKRELKASVGAGGKLKGFIFGGVEISEKDIAQLLEELELSLVESDVEQDAANEIVRQIKQSLVGKKVSVKKLDEYLNEEIRRILTEMMTTEKVDVLGDAKRKEQKPYRILMLGPNGAGKTTSIAKLTKYFQKNGMSCIWAAGDTFRAAAIDQLEEHGKRLGVRVVKQQYGADPAAVAFDAIRAAEAGKTDVVIIDSAGRQETNKNLMEELKKIERVAKPDLKIYVGEAYAGQGLLDQATEFSEAIGIDGFILTKIDADAKGGTTISLLYKLRKPILFVGTGQGYDDLKEFSPEFILKRII